MTYQIERLATVYSTDRGEHQAWRKLRGDAANALEWRTQREALAFADLLSPKGTAYRVVEITEAET